MRVSVVLLMRKLQTLKRVVSKEVPQRMKARLHQVFLNQASSSCFVQVVCNSYLTWGILQERIVTQTYEEHLPDDSVTLVKFTKFQCLVFVNRSLALVVASVCILFIRQPRHTAPLYEYSYSSFSNIMSSWCPYKALKYLSFQTKVFCKASKIIPVMIMGKIVSTSFCSVVLKRHYE